MSWPTSSTHKQLQRFLGFANFYQRFIKNFSCVVLPLTSLTSPLVVFSGHRKPNKLFHDLRSYFAPLLSSPTPMCPGSLLLKLTLQMRAQELCCLKFRWTMCAFFLVGNCEIPALKLALEELHHWLEGAEHPFVIWTDHRNLIYIRNVKRLNSRQTRWQLFFSRFNWLISFHLGSHNMKADALLRQFSSEAEASDVGTIVPPPAWWGPWYGRSRLWCAGFSSTSLIRDRDLRVSYLFRPPCARVSCIGCALRLSPWHSSYGVFVETVLLVAFVGEGCT